VLGVIPAAPSGAVEAPFEAYASGTDQLRYTGMYRMSRVGDLIREYHQYFDLGGNQVYEIETAFDVALMRPVSYAARDAVLGTVVEAVVQDRELRYEMRRVDGRLLGHGVHTLAQDTYLWPNLALLIYQHWPTLIDGTDLGLDLFLFSVDSNVAFRLARSAADAREATLTLTPRNLFIRALVSPVVFTVSMEEPRRLLQVDGRSVVRDEAGRSQNLRLVFGTPRVG
jgi:hypothetical protein